jgi:hypothetical protein
MCQIAPVIELTSLQAFVDAPELKELAEVYQTNANRSSHDKIELRPIVLSKASPSAATFMRLRFQNATRYNTLLGNRINPNQQV